MTTTGTLDVRYIAYVQPYAYQNIERQRMMAAERDLRPRQPAHRVRRAAAVVAGLLRPRPFPGRRPAGIGAPRPTAG